MQTSNIRRIPIARVSNAKIELDLLAVRKMLDPQGIVSLNK